MNIRFREQARSHRDPLLKQKKNAPIIADRGVFYCLLAGYAAIDNLSLFIALFSS